MTFDIDDLIATAAPRTREVQVCARGDLVDRHAVLLARLAAASEDDASIAGNPEIERLAGEIVAVQDEQESHTLTLTIHSVSRRAWADTLAKHPPRTQDKGLDHNPETFPPAAVAACSDITIEQATKLADTLPVGEWVKLWNAAIVLNVAETPHPKLAVATEILRQSDGS